MSDPSSEEGQDEEALNAAWAVLRAGGVGDGLLGVIFLERYGSFVLHYEEEGSGYREWVRLPIESLERLPAEALEEAARRLARRVSLTRIRP